MGWTKVVFSYSSSNLKPTVPSEKLLPRLGAGGTFLNSMGARAHFGISNFSGALFCSIHYVLLMVPPSLGAECNGNDRAALNPPLVGGETESCTNSPWDTI